MVYVATVVAGLSRLGRVVFSWLDGRLRGAGWEWKVTLAALVTGLLLSFPAYHRLDAFDLNWERVEAQIEEPFAERDYPPHSHGTKLAFRLTVPLIAHPLGLRREALLVLAAICGIALVFLSVRLAYAVTGDRVAGALAAGAVTFTWTGLIGFLEIRGIMDVVALLLLVAAMTVRRPALVALFTFAAAFTDERAVLAAVLVGAFHLVRRDSRAALGAAAGVAAYAAGRAILLALTDLHTPSAGVEPGDSWEALPFGAWTALEGAWLFVAAGLAALLAQRRLPEAALLAAGLILVAALAGSVVDVTRSMSYALPAVFLGLAALRPEGRQTVRWLALAALVISLLWPVYYVASGDYVLQRPLPLQVGR